MRSTVQPAQLDEPPAESRRGAIALDRDSQAVEDLVVRAEDGEVFECQIQGASDRPRVAQVTELVPLALPACHSGGWKGVRKGVTPPGGRAGTGR